MHVACSVGLKAVTTSRSTTDEMDEEDAPRTRARDAYHCTTTTDHRRLERRSEIDEWERATERSESKEDEKETVEGDKSEKETTVPACAQASEKRNLRQQLAGALSTAWPRLREQTRAVAACGLIPKRSSRKQTHICPT
jgi:DNA repair exonuclease SbcCD ATPase subunit